MTVRDLVPCSGVELIGDSSYYGDADLKTEYEEDLKAFDPLEFWRTHERNFELVRAQAKLSEKNAGTRRKRKMSDETAGVDDSDRKRRKKGKNEDTGAKDEPTPSTVTASPSPPADDAVIFDNPFQGTVSGKQNEESASEFLKRVPPSTTTPADIKDAWIWVANPKVKHTYSGRVGNFKEDGFAILEHLDGQRAQFEAENPTKAASAITRMMKPFRDGAQAQLAKLAKTNSVTSGKWLLFPQVSDVDRIWRTVVEGTWSGRLGMSAKVAPNDPSGGRKDERVICIYTPDFADLADVKFVLSSMRDLGLVGDGSSDKIIYYKCDFVTHLDLLSGNEYKLPTTMYNSRELFKGMASSRGGKS